MKARRAVNTVTVEKRDRGIAELGGAIDKGFGKRRPL